MANSIIQTDTTRCYLCGRPAAYNDPLDKHHIFGGCKAIRDKAEEYGLTVYLHHNACHIFGPQAVHVNAKNARELKAEAQRAAMERYGWTVEDFRREFYKNYL